LNRHGALKRFAALVRRTPLHPQWLLDDDRRRWLRSICTAPGRVLDIGCADRWAEPCLPAGSHYIGADYPTTVRQLYDTRPDLFVDAGRLPLRDATVDTVIFLEVLEHLRRPEAAWTEIVRVLKPGGRVVMSVPFLYPAHDEPHDYQRLTAHGLARDAEHAGLAVQQVEPFLRSAHTAGLLLAVTLAGTALQAVAQRRPSMLLVPLLLLMVPVVNLCAWAMGRMLPSWNAVAAGYTLIASKP
jgi:SAM-dependent methyltransferase